jgi:hypothetical protein
MHGRKLASISFSLLKSNMGLVTVLKKPMLDLSKEKEIDANLRPCMHLIECAFATFNQMHAWS